MSTQPILFFLCYFYPVIHPFCLEKGIKFDHASSSTGLSWREYMRYSSDDLKSILPCSICLRVTDSMGWGRPMDSRKDTAEWCCVISQALFCF